MLQGSLCYPNFSHLDQGLGYHRDDTGTVIGILNFLGSRKDMLQDLLRLLGFAYLDQSLGYRCKDPDALIVALNPLGGGQGLL